MMNYFVMHVVYSKSHYLAFFFNMVILLTFCAVLNYIMRLDQNISNHSLLEKIFVVKMRILFNLFVLTVVHQLRLFGDVI